MNDVIMRVVREEQAWLERVLRNYLGTGFDVAVRRSWDGLTMRLDAAPVTPGEPPEYGPEWSVYEVSKLSAEPGITPDSGVKNIPLRPTTSPEKP